MDVQTILNLVFGGGFLATLVKLFWERRKQRADTGLVEAETEETRSKVESANLGIVSDRNRTINDLMADLETTVGKMRVLNSQITSLHDDNHLLNQSLTNAQAIIKYQKEERHEWTVTLERVLKRNVELEAEMKTLAKRVLELEKANEKPGE